MLKARARLFKCVYEMRAREDAQEKCSWTKSRRIDLVITQCGERVSKSSIFSSGSQYKFCPFCGKEIKNEWIRR